MSIARKDPRVDAYVASLPDWQQRLCTHTRELLFAADPALVETVKRTNRPYYVLEGNVCALLAAKDHVNIFIYDPVAPDPHKLINQGEGNATARAIQLYENDALPDQAFIELVQAIIARNRAGGWRKLQNHTILA